MSLSGKGLVDKALVLVALALAALVVATRESVTTTEVNARRNNVLPAWRPTELTSIRLEGQREVHLEKRARPDSDQAEWMLSGAGFNQVVADPAAVDQLLSALGFASWVRTLDANQEDVKGLGFEHPRGSLQLSMGDLDYRLVVGKAAPAPSGSAYLQVFRDGKPEASGIVKQAVVDAVLIDPREFLGRTLVPAARSDITRLELSGAGGSRRLQREGHRFRFEGNDARLVDGESLDPVFFHLARLSAEEFLSVDEAKKRLEGQEHVDIKIWTEKAKAALEVSVGGRCPGSGRVVALRRAPNPVAGCVPESVMAGLTLTADALLDRTPFGFGPDEVERVVTNHGNQRLELVRNENGFLLKAPVEAEVDLARGNLRLDNLVHATGTIVDKPDLSALGLSPPQGTTQVTGLSPLTDEAVEETVALGRVDREGRLPILRRADGVVLLLPPEAARAFRVDATLSRSLRLFDFEQKDLISIETKTENLEQRLTRAGDEFKLEEPEGFDFDATLVSTLVDKIQGLAAERWVSDDDDGTFGLDHPQGRLVVKWRKNEQNVEATLEVGKRLPGGFYASLSGVPGVFVLSTQAWRDISTPVLSRAAFAIDTDRLQAIVFETKERTVRVVARGSGWASETPGVDSDYAERLVQSIGALKPDFAWRVGPPAPGDGFDPPTLLIEAVAATGKTTFRIGRTQAFSDGAGYLARAEGVNATFVLPAEIVRGLLDLL